MSKEIIRRATNHDIMFIMAGIQRAKQQLALHQSGQWQFGEPSEFTIHNDIAIGQYWVLAIDHHILGGCAVLSYEPAYDHLITGQWLNQDPYRVIHRFYIHPSYQKMGYSKQLLGFVESNALSDGIHNIRLDTHERNTPMRKTLEKSHYTHVGEAYLPQAGTRFVYHKVI